MGASLFSGKTESSKTEGCAGCRGEPTGCPMGDMCAGDLCRWDHDTMTLNKEWVAKTDCPLGAGCVGKSCEWNHAAMKKGDVKQKCPMGNQCADDFCEWNHDPIKK
jgi:hypothetical protein